MPHVWRTIRTWGEMIKFSHSVFALPFALLATFLAARPGLPSLGELLLVVGCMVAARSAAMTFNRIVDLRYDAANPRTANRPLVTGAIRPGAAWMFFLLSSGGFVLCCAGFWWFSHNPWPLLLSLPTLGFLCFYSYTKRFTEFSHLLLGLAIAFSPVAAWIAISPRTLGAPAWLLMLAVATWIAGFDIIYACQDTAFDRHAGLRSLPARLGIPRALWVTRLLHFVTVLALLAVGRAASLGTLYFAGVACVGLLLVIENALVRGGDLRYVNLAFFTVNGCVGLLLGVMGILDIMTND